MKKTLYLLGEEGRGMDIRGIYSTHAKAVEAAKYFEGVYDIHIFELDPEPEGEVFEDYYLCIVDPTEKGEKSWGGKCRQNPSKHVSFEFSEMYFKRTVGYGKSPERAEANAIFAQTQIHPVWIVWMEDEKKRDWRRQVSHPSCAIKFGKRINKPYAYHEDFNVAKIAMMEYQATGKLSPYLTIPK